MSPVCLIVRVWGKHLPNMARQRLPYPVSLQRSGPGSGEQASVLHRVASTILCRTPNEVCLLSFSAPSPPCLDASPQLGGRAGFFSIKHLAQPLLPSSKRNFPSICPCTPPDLTNIVGLYTHTRVLIMPLFISAILGVNNPTTQMSNRNHRHHVTCLLLVSNATIKLQAANELL